ncbi:phosphatase PAP2 family protein [Devosia pacifica]|uniref:Phosphatase PAP2 family protein n=1 Tax=Devosia pacifica TaxID=1335967 RepID=A0A918SFW1_9HYPH|nr:phosphatase PAP2 family protein [Devosia pacifica]GHA37089.1 phosphatase PAP2 family protein [Devosia pacifica]
MSRLEPARLPWKILDLVRGEFLLLVTLGLACGLGWGFLELADEVDEGETEWFDTTVLAWFRAPGNVDQMAGPPWLHEVGRDITALGSYTVLLIFVFGVVGSFLLRRKAGAAIVILASVAGGALLSSLLKIGYGRSRPELESAAEHFTNSFPSGHATLSAVTYLTIGALMARLSEDRILGGFYLGFAMCLTLLVGISRLYLGVHFPSDVVAGWALGAGWALFCSGVALLLQRMNRLRDKSSS